MIQKSHFIAVKSNKKTMIKWRIIKIWIF